MGGLSDLVLAVLAGFAGGAVLGLAARLGRFCALGAIEDAIYAGDWRRARMWSLAAAVAIAGTFVLEASGVASLAQSRFLSIGWVPLASVAGGLMFGYGMALVGTCAYGALARLGGGDLRALVMALVIGVSGYAAASGVLAAARTGAFPVEPLTADVPPGFAHALAHLTGAPALLFAGCAAAGLGWLALSDAAFRSDRRRVVWSVAAGLAIVWGWAATGWLARTGWGGVALDSYSFVAPTGETLLFMMAATGVVPSFGVGAVAGVITGAAAGALIRGEFRWEACDEPRELRRQLFGAALMGVGGIIAVGCTIGQGLAAASLLAFSAPVVVAAIVLGAWAGLRSLILSPL